VEIGLLAGIFGRFGFFRSRPNTSWDRLAIGGAVVAAVVAVIAVVWLIPFYTNSETNLLELTFFGSDVSPEFVVLGWIVALILIGSVVGLLALLFVRRDLGAAFVFVAGLTCGSSPRSSGPIRRLSSAA
jgi:hypothetical protein